MVVDLTVPLTPEMPTLSGLPGFEAEQLASYESNGNVVHAFSTNTHQGTHVDAPAHYVEGGATVDDLSLDLLRGRAAVFDLRASAGEAITAARLRDADPCVDADRALLCSGDVDERYADESFFTDAAYLTEDAADWLLAEGYRLVGNDFMTEAVPGDPARPVHNALLGAGVPVVEYLRNTGAVADREAVGFACLPLLIPGFEAAPARAYAELP